VKQQKTAARAKRVTRTIKPSTKKEDPRRAFVRQLAVYLADKQALRSIALEMGEQHAKEWAALRATTPLFGYPTMDEAEQQLAKWLGLEKPTVQP